MEHNTETGQWTSMHSKRDHKLPYLYHSNSDPGKCLPLIILTACSRLHSLTTISASLKAHLYDMEWRWVICTEDACSITHFEPMKDCYTFNRVRNPPESTALAMSSHAKVGDLSHFRERLLSHAIDMVHQFEIRGLLFFLDDDTIVPPETRSAIRIFCREYFPQRLAFTVKQMTKQDSIRIDVATNPCRMDRGCYFIHTDLVSSHQFSSQKRSGDRKWHDADQRFYHEIRSKTGNLWIDLPIVGSIYNALAEVDC